MSAQLIHTPESKRVHLGTFAVNAGSGHDGYRTGRMVPICSTDPGITLWSYWCAGWDKPKPLCRACMVRLDEFSALALAASTEER